MIKKVIKSTKDTEKMLEDYIKDNPEIGKWLKVFNITKEQILKNMEQDTEDFPISTYSSAE